MTNGGAYTMTKGLDITSSRQAALTGKSNRSDVVPLDAHIKQLRRVVDDLYWNNEFDRADLLQEELDYLVKLQLDGQRYHCLF